METKERISTLLGKLKSKLSEANDILEELTQLGHDFNRKDGEWDFSIDPKNIRGQLMEVIASQLMTDDIYVTTEVKSEGPHAWMRNGNLFVECQKQIGKNGSWVNSGIRISKAQWWIHILKNGDGLPFALIAMPIKTLLDRIELLGCPMIKNKDERNDGNNTYGYLVPIREVLHRKGDYHMFKIDEELKIKNK